MVPFGIHYSVKSSNFADRDYAVYRQSVQTITSWRVNNSDGIGYVRLLSRLFDISSCLRCYNDDGLRPIRRIYVRECLLVVVLALRSLTHAWFLYLAYPSVWCGVSGGPQIRKFYLFFPLLRSCH